MEQTTICAISTPPGTGGIAVARVSGPDAIATVQKIWHGRPLAACPSHTAHLGTIDDTDGQQLDQAVATVFRAPHSFTGDDTVELSVHGSQYVQRELLASLIKAGAQLAQPGEYTRRAFASGHLDLTQAEAVADIIASTNRAAHRLAINQMRGGISRRLSQLRDKLLEIASLLELELDFSEEDVQFASRDKLMALAREIEAEISRLLRTFRTGSAIRQGIPVAIAGVTNVGKSSLLNTLVGDERAIVSDIHGTTRDLIEDTITIGDYQFRFIDTAGLRHTDDHIEAIGIDRARQAIDRARIVLIVLDATTPAIPDDIDKTIRTLEPSTPLILCINKCDIADPATLAVTLKTLLPKTHTLAHGTINDNLPQTHTPAPDADVEATDGDFPQVHTPAPDADVEAVNGESPQVHIIEISALTGQGIDTLREQLTQTVRDDIDMQTTDILITNARHSEALAAALQSVRRVIDGLHAGISGDFIAQDLRDTLRHLGDITGGQITTPTILATIFSRFCVGK